MEIGSPGRKVALVEFGTGPFDQKDELAGCWVVLVQPRVVLAEQMAEQTGRRVDPGVDQLVQMVGWAGQWVGLVVRKADRPAQKGTLAGFQVVLVAHKVVLLVQMDNLAGHQVDLVGCKVAPVAQMGNLVRHHVDLVGCKVVLVAQKDNLAEH